MNFDAKNSTTSEKTATSVERVIHFKRAFRLCTVETPPSIRSAASLETQTENPAVAKVAKRVYTDIMT